MGLDSCMDTWINLCADSFAIPSIWERSSPLNRREASCSACISTWCDHVCKHAWYYSKLQVAFRNAFHKITSQKGRCRHGSKAYAPPFSNITLHMWYTKVRCAWTAGWLGGFFLFVPARPSAPSQSLLHQRIQWTARNVAPFQTVFAPTSHSPRGIWISKLPRRRWRR